MHECRGIVRSAGFSLPASWSPFSFPPAVLRSARRSCSSLIGLAVCAALLPAAARAQLAVGNIETVAGDGMRGDGGDGGAATSASLDRPHGVAVDAAGNLYIADLDNHRIRKVDTAGNISTVAGNGMAAYSGDGGQATSASLNRPEGVAVDTANNLYIADRSEERRVEIESSSLWSP